MPKHNAAVKPTQADLEAARGTTVPDVIAVDLPILFVGINPSLYSAAVGRHFARPGNRFWPALEAGGVTDRRLSPFEDHRLLEYGCGVTNIVGRATARADELSQEELAAGTDQLGVKVRRHKIACVAFLGLTAYRAAFDRPQVGVGPQDETLGGAGIHLLPNPSGLNAHYQLPDFARMFRELWQGFSSISP